MQTAGELDYGNLFEEASLLYTPMAIILFVTFVVLMPVLFSNLLVRVLAPRVYTRVMFGCVVMSVQVVWTKVCV